MDKLRLIMDCDCTMGVPGCDVDDSLALLYVLDCPEAELLGVTCSFGNNTQDTVYRNTKRQGMGQGGYTRALGRGQPQRAAQRGGGVHECSGKGTGRR